MLYTDSSGNMCPIVCIVCDRFITTKNRSTVALRFLIQKYKLLEPVADSSFHIDLKIHYTAKYTGFFTTRNDERKFKKCFLSPRAPYVPSIPHKKQDEGFTICQQCKVDLTSNVKPEFCIANNYMFGPPPKCLTDLNDIELAMISPVRTYGFCFSYTGGVQKNMKGSLSYYRLDQDTILKAVARFEALGLQNSNTVVLLYGNLTKSQYLKAKKKSKVRPWKIKSAVEWLTNNNQYWLQHQGKVEKYMETFQYPPFVDCSTKIPDGTNNCEIEHAETFQVFFPDGTTRTTTGGQNTVQELHQIIRDAENHGFDIVYKTSAFNEAVQDFKGNNFVDGNLLQFPYGRGGLTENREKRDGTYSTVVDISSYTKYISEISLPHFHYELFTLKLYNMQLKNQMAKSARWKIRNKGTAELLANEITIQDVDNAITQHRNKTYNHFGETSAGHRLLTSIDAICKLIPHTNEAAKKAKGDLEAMQHTFGCPTFFLTITPDDDYHMIVHAYSGGSHLLSQSFETMSNNDIYELSKSKINNRIKHPGVCAFFFEAALDIVFNNVIGWDRQSNSHSVSNPSGIFGKIDALFASIEEQGRRTLHAHILIWVHRLNVVRNKIYSPNRHIARAAMKTIVENIDMVCSNKSFFNDANVTRNSRTTSQAFRHNCRQHLPRSQNTPVIVGNQELRNLRAKRSSPATVSFCRCCNKTWSATDMVSSYLHHAVSLPNSDDMCFDNNIQRLRNLSTQFQCKGGDDELAPSYIADFGYNHHVHTSSCFKSKMYDINGNPLCDECRYRFPQPKKQRTCFQKTSELLYPWYSWHGTSTQRYIYEIALQRAAFDVFQNNYCPHISYSKLMCNTNIAYIIPGLIANYCSGYATKKTQKDEVKEYEMVRVAAERALTTTKYENETLSTVAMRRLLRTTYAHQSNNIVGATMASYLTKNTSRFYFSHQFCWCPLRDIKTLLNDGKISAHITMSPTSAHFQCEALHYLCRPVELEQISAYDFFSQYAVCKTSSSNSASKLSFTNSAKFVHPSYSQKTKKFRDCVVPRKQTKIIKVHQHHFPDTASFNGDILQSETTITTTTEQYSEYVLLLLWNY
jgi:Helitron helicase-like domain at N-terminus